jgi:hypothetical protein
VGEKLDFYFDYVTSDGSGYADYAWARLLDASTSAEVAILFTARTNPTLPIVPGTGLPAAASILNPASVLINLGTTWSPLDESSGTCYNAGCGNSGWVESTYTIGAAGSYKLQYGVTNWLDTAYDSGMAVDGATIAGVPIEGVVPEPTTILLFGTGIGALALVRRRRAS